MSIKPIVTVPAEILKQRCEPATGDQSELIKDLTETMQAAHGLGLSAPQIGIPLRVFVIETKAGSPLAFINPRIVCSIGRELAEEGCLSIPGLRVEIQRARMVKVEQDGQPTRWYRNLAARAIQHELDHLDGVLITDMDYSTDITDGSAQ